MLDPHTFSTNDDPKGFRKQMYGGYFALVAILIQTYRSDIDRQEKVMAQMDANAKAIELRIDKVDGKLADVDKKLVNFSRDIVWLQDEVKDLRKGVQDSYALAKRVTALEESMNKKSKRSH